MIRQNAQSDPVRLIYLNQPQNDPQPKANLILIISRLDLLIETDKLAHFDDVQCIYTQHTVGRPNLACALTISQIWILFKHSTFLFTLTNHPKYITIVSTLYGTIMEYTNEKCFKFHLFEKCLLSSVLIQTKKYYPFSCQFYLLMLTALISSIYYIFIFIRRRAYFFSLILCPQCATVIPDFINVSWLCVGSHCLYSFAHTFFHSVPFRHDAIKNFCYCRWEIKISLHLSLSLSVWKMNKRKNHKNIEVERDRIYVCVRECEWKSKRK